MLGSAAPGASTSATLTIRNAGGGSLSYVATTADSWIGGLSAIGNGNLNGGQATSGTLNLVCADAEETRAGSIEVTSSGGTSTSISVPVTLTCEAPALTLAIVDAPDQKSGAPTVPAEATFSWRLDSTWAEQPDVLSLIHI